MFCLLLCLKLDKGVAKVKEFFPAVSSVIHSISYGLILSQERRITLKNPSPSVFLTLKMYAEERLKVGTFFRKRILLVVAPNTSAFIQVTLRSQSSARQLTVQVMFELENNQFNFVMKSVTFI